MAENKTQPSATPVADFLAAVADPGRRQDAATLATLMGRLSGQAPAMWGTTIIGYGSYHYRYDSGREGDAPRIGFSPRKAELVLYILSDAAGNDAQLARLGKHRAGKGCLYIRKLADVDMQVLEELVRDRLAAMAARYPA